MKIVSAILAAIIPIISFANSGEESFTKVELNSIGKVIIMQGDSNYVEINTSGSKEGIDTKVKHGTLYIESSVDAEYRITMKNIEGLSVSGTGEITSSNTINADHLRLDVSGSGKMTLALQAKDLSIDISGVGKLVLSGKADNANVSISGSGKVDAFDLQVANCKAEISGVGKCNIDVTESLTSDISGMGSVNYKNKPTHVSSDVSGVGSVKDNSESESHEAETHETEAREGKSDTTHLSFGDVKVLIVRSDSAVARRKSRNEKSKPIWGGLELGFNNFVGSGGKMEVPKGYEFLDLNTGKSICVSLNLLQKNFRLGHSNAWFFTGLGLTWNNYRFDKNVNLTSAADTISGDFDTTSTRTYTKSKLTAAYLTLPLMFEFFTSNKSKNALHLGVGAMLGYKIGSHTKTKFTESGSTEKPKQYDDFYLNPFRYGARVSIGYRKFNVFADYYASTLFRDKKGPELFPVSVGITLAAF
ncbi:MAG: DUF2807 domain-containing protein [Bacteroidota bacterium]